MTFGADGTTHRNINYDARHVHYKVKSSTDEDGTSQQKTRLLGVQSTFDGSSEQSVKDWKDLLSNIASIYRHLSPNGLAKFCLVPECKCKRLVPKFYMPITPLGIELGFHYILRLIGKKL